MTEKKLNATRLRVMKADITLLEVDAFVFYASPNLKLGTGFGGAIAVRGGPSIQEELDRVGQLETTRAVATGAGQLKAKHIIHAVGPRFQEPETEAKLAATVRSALQVAEEKGARRLALPPMGAGFFGVPLDVSARVTLDAIKEHVLDRSRLEEITVCVVDSRELKPFADRLAAI